MFIQQKKSDLFQFHAQFEARMTKERSRNWAKVILLQFSCRHSALSVSSTILLLLSSCYFCLRQQFVEHFTGFWGEKL